MARFTTDVAYGVLRLLGDSEETGRPCFVRFFVTRVTRNRVLFYSPLLQFVQLVERLQRRQRVHVEGFDFFNQGIGFRA